MPDKIEAAAVQMDPKIFEKRRNLDNCVRLIRASRQHGAELIVFPECALPGYCFSSLDEAQPLAETIPGPSTDEIAEVCEEVGAHTIVGMIEKDDHKYYNAAALIGPEGWIGTYRKIHLPYLGVDRFLDAGNRPFEVYDTNVGKIGISICYDAGFPEAARVMALDGAEILALPTNWPEGAERIPEYVVNARAFENRVNFIAANRSGRERNFRFIGRSKIVNFVGETLAEASGDEEEVLYAELDLAQARNKHVVIAPGEFELNRLKDRRPEFYGKITESVSENL